MITEEILMRELQKEWSKKGSTFRYLYVTDVDFPYLNRKIQQKIQDYEDFLEREDISLESYLKAIRECLILCRLVESIKLSREAAMICSLDMEEYKMYEELLLYSY